MAGPNQKPGPTAIRAPTLDLDNHKTVLTQLKETTEIASRLRGNPSDSYIKVGELVDAGLINFIGGIISPNVHAVNAITGINVADSITGDASLASPLKLVGDTASPGNSKYYGTDGSGSRGFWSVPSVYTPPVTTKGDIFGYSTVPDRIPVGSNGKVLTADSTASLGVSWQTPASGSSPLTTKGDLYGHSTVDARIPVGTDGFVLTADSTQTLGLKWSAVTGTGTVTSVSVSSTDLSVSGSPITTSGTITLDINAGAVTLGKMANLAANSIIGNNTGSPATPIALTATQVKTLLAISYTDVSGLATVAHTGAYSDLTGLPTLLTSPLTTKGDLWGFSTVNARIPVGTDAFVLTADSTQTLGVKWSAPTSGAVTSVGVSSTDLSVSGSPITTSGTITLNINAAAVTLGKMANLAANSIIGNNTGSPATPLALTASQVKTLLAIAYTDVSGLATVAHTGAYSDLTGTPAAQPLTTKGDLFGFSTVAARIPIGTDTFVLTADSTQTLGLKWAAAAAGVSGANPTASVGLTAVNGSATTYLRSDGAPALNQAISPTMTGTWIIQDAATGATTPLTVGGAGKTGGTLTASIQNASTTNGDTAHLTITANATQVALFAANAAQSTAVVTGGPTGAQAVLRTLGSYPLVFGTNNTYRGQIDANGAWIIAAPTTNLSALTVNQASGGQYAVTIQGISTAGASNGVLINAGTNASDTPFAVVNASGATSFFNILGDGSGHLGPTAATGISWTATGIFTILTPSGAGTHTINSNTGALDTLSLNAPSGRFTSLLFNNASAIKAQIFWDNTNSFAQWGVPGNGVKLDSSGIFFRMQPAPTAVNATATLTIAQLLTTIITSTTAAAVTATLPTGTLTDAGVMNGASAANDSFDWYVINTGGNTFTVAAAASGHTIVGAAAVATGTSAHFRTRKTAANTFVTYRIAV
jgi:hypothetical protein